MHLVPSNIPAANTNDYSAVHVGIVTDVELSAANDCASGPTVRHAVDVNALVGRVVGHVMSKQRSGPSVDVQLTLAPGRHWVQVNPVAMSFALSGILAAQLSAVDETDGTVSVATSASIRGVTVTISADGIPPLGFVRALDGDADPSLGNPTLAHCRRLIEEQGGSIALVEQNGRIALRIAFPPVLPSNVVPLQPANVTAATLVAVPRLVA